MNIEFDTQTVLTILLVLAVLYWFVQQREKWTLLGGAEQKWAQLPREAVICDTGYNDEECKFSAVNCLDNPHSYFYKNE